MMGKTYYPGSQARSNPVQPVHVGDNGEIVNPIVSYLEST